MRQEADCRAAGGRSKLSGKVPGHLPHLDTLYLRVESPDRRVPARRSDQVEQQADRRLPGRRSARGSRRSHRAPPAGRGPQPRASRRKTSLDPLSSIAGAVIGATPTILVSARFPVPVSRLVPWASARATRVHEPGDRRSGGQPVRCSVPVGHGPPSEAVLRAARHQGRRLAAFTAVIAAAGSRSRGCGGV
jgi:hypothetical protein